MKIPIRSLWVLGLWLALGQVGLVRSSAITFYTLGIPKTFASGHVVTPDGTVAAGVSRDAHGKAHAFRWTAQAGQMEDLGSLGGDVIEVKFISDDGTVIVGVGENSSRNRRGFRWAEGEGMSDLGILGSAGGDEEEPVVLRAMTANGAVIIGLSPTSSGEVHAFRWAQLMVDLGTLGGRSEPTAISADGTTVVGWSSTPLGDRAFRWTTTSPMTDLGTLGGDFSRAVAVSGDGAVVAGSSLTVSGVEHAFRWTATTALMQDLGTLGAGYPASSVQFLSVDGNVVVGSCTTDSGVIHSFRWTPAGMVDLNTLGGVYAVAQAMTANGAVVVGQSQTAAGADHAFRWTGAGMVDLDDLDGVSSAAQAVSRDGAVVLGTRWTNFGESHAIRWTESGLTSDLLNFMPRSMSADGSVLVGEAKRRSAVLWTEQGSMDLGDLGVFLGGVTEITSMNRDGTVVVGQGGESHGDQGFRWTQTGLAFLQTPEGTSSASDVSDDGVAVGQSEADGHFRATLWAPGRLGQDLGALEPESISSSAQAISASGAVVVGDSSTSSGKTHAVRWINQTEIQDLGTMGNFTLNSAQFVSDDGTVIVGNSTGPGSRAFLWAEPGPMQDLGTLGGASSRAMGISASGAVVVGWSTLASGQQRVFRWTEGVMKHLLTPGDASADFVSDDGSIVVGQTAPTATSGKVRHVFRWTEGTGVVDLGTLGGTVSEPLAISADGNAIVGASTTASGIRHAFLWTSDGGMQDLTSLLADLAPDIEISEANGISFDGAVISGQARGPDGEQGWVAQLAPSAVVARAGPDQHANANSACLGKVFLDGSASAGSGLTFEWSEAGNVIANVVNPFVNLSTGTHTITLKVTDDQGQTASDSLVVLVKDVTPPVPNLASLPTLSGQCSVTITSAPRATDNCTGLVTGTTTDVLTYTEPGLHSVIWHYVDGNGNESTQQQDINVLPGINPVPDVENLPAVSGQCSATITTVPTATDSCGVTITGVTTDPLTYTEPGTHTVTWHYAGGDGNETTQTQEVSISPSGTAAPLPDVRNLPAVSGQCSATIVTVPTATDNCGGAIAGETTDPLTYTELGSHFVTWHYVDSNENESTQTQEVVVLADSTPPLPDTTDLPVIRGQCSVAVSPPTATDNCADAITGETTDPLTYTALGTYFITWHFPDGNGNESTQTQQIDVVDTAPPVPNAANLPTVSGQCSVTVSTIPTATDKCAGAITGTTTNPLTYIIPGTYTVIWTYQDGHGNSSTQQQTVIVQAPTATTLAYNGATSSAPGGAPVTLSATLSSGTGKKAQKPSGLLVTFTLGTSTASALTDNNGTATVTLAPPATAGSYPLTASYAGSCSLASSTVSKTFMVKKK